MFDKLLCVIYNYRYTFNVTYGIGISTIKNEKYFSMLTNR